MNLKLQCKSRTIYAFLMALFSVWGWGQKTYKLITSVSDLTAGSKYLIVSRNTQGSGYALGYQATSNRPIAAVSIDTSLQITTSVATVSTDMTNPYELTLGGATGSWSIYDSVNNGYIYASSNSSNYLKTQSASSTWTIAFNNNGAAVLTSQSGYTNNILRYNSNNGNGLFSCYASNQSSVYLYKETITCTAPTISSNPADVLVTSPATAQFSVSATGTNLTYKWQKSTDSGSTWSDITSADGSGMSNNTYTTPSTTVSMSGNLYRAVVYSGTCSTTSNAATLTVNPNTSPSISVTSNALSGFTYQFGNGPSLSQNFTVTGSNLTNNLDIITPSNNYEYSTANNGTYTTSLSLAPNAGSINQIIYAKLKAGLPGGSYLDVAILGSNGAAVKIVTLSGNVTAPVPIVNTSTNSLSGFNYLKDNGPSTEQSFTISGNNLGSDIIITAPTHYEISTTTGNSFSNSINLSQVNGTVSNQTIYVRLKSNFGIGTYNENITVTSGSFIQPILVKGYVTSPVVISQIYGGGGNSGAPIKYDFIELYNKSNKPVTLNGHYLYYSSSTFSNSSSSSFTGLPDFILLPGQYYVIKQSGGNSGQDFNADFTGNITMSSTSGKVALTSSSTPPTGSSDSSVIDFVGYGSASDYLGSGSTGSLNNSKGTFRKNSGMTDTRDNANDFDIPATPNPRNTSSLANITDPNLVVWNGSAWAGTPSATTDVYITGNYNEPNLVPVKDLYVYNGKTLTVNTSVNANNVINNGNIVVNDNSNFFQDVNSIYSGTGNFKVLKNGNSAHNKYAFWSSPVVGQDLNVIYGSLTPDFITEYDTPTDYFVNAGSTTSVFGKGYSIKTPDVPSNHVVTFTGVPNNGTQTFALSNGGNRYNLVGNPYPSDLNLDALYALNASKITSTFYFWDNASASVTTQSGGTTSNYGYATYNASATSGTSGTFVASPNAGSINPSGNVAKIGQGFFVRLMPNLSNNTSLNFDNSLRVASTGTFFNKNNNAGVGKYWLRLSSSYGTNNTLAVTYSPAASNSYDAFDSKAIAMGSDGFYTVADAQKLIIQGRETFNINDVVPVGTKHFENGNFTIALIQKEGLFNNGQAVYLHDKVMGTYTDLQNGSYSFAANVGEISNRFEIVYKLGVLSTSEVTKDAFEVYRNGEDFFVRNDKNIDSVTIYDASGRQIQTLNGGAKEIRISLNAKGVYLVKAVSQGKEYTKKIIK